MCDEFYTKQPEVFKEIIDDYLELLDFKFLVEPSCGNGAFLKLFDFDLCYDIVKRVEHEKFVLKDFLTTTNDEIPINSTFIGNPPFGKNSSLAIQFCNHCCELQAKYIMFILPVVFRNKKYQSKAFTNDYQFMEEFEYNQFIKDGKNVSVECVFQIWQRNENKLNKTNSKIIPKQTTIKPHYFRYISKSEINSKKYSPTDRTFSIRRVGSKTPELTDGIHSSLEDHFVIELNDNVDISSFINNYNNYNFTLSPSTKQKHINKDDLNKQLNLFDIQFIKDDNEKEIEKINNLTITTITTSSNYKNKLNTFCQHIQQLTNVQVKPEDILKDEYFSSLLITPQSKAVFRGNIFNDEVYNSFKSILPPNAEIIKEYKDSRFPEILDLYIKLDDRELCIYNQIDLWSGGEQLNRCDKYLSKPHENILCVVLSKPNFTSRSKAYKLIIPNIGKHIIWYSEIKSFAISYFELD